MDVARGMVIIKNPNNTEGNLRDFTFDAVYDWKYVPHCIDTFVDFVCCSSKQKDLYDETFRPIVESVLEGYNGSLSYCAHYTHTLSTCYAHILSHTHAYRQKCPSYLVCMQVPYLPMVKLAQERHTRWKVREHHYGNMLQ